MSVDDRGLNPSPVIDPDWEMSGKTPQASSLTGLLSWPLILLASSFLEPSRLAAVWPQILVLGPYSTMNSSLWISLPRNTHLQMPGALSRLQIQHFTHQMVQQVLHKQQGRKASPDITADTKKILLESELSISAQGQSVSSLPCWKIKAV